VNVRFGRGLTGVPRERAPRFLPHLVLRLLAGLVLLYTARARCKGQVTMEEIVLSRKHHWRLLESEMLE
jgi:hypothetical protein